MCCEKVPNLIMIVSIIWEVRFWSKNDFRTLSKKRHVQKFDSLLKTYAVKEQFSDNPVQNNLEFFKVSEQIPFTVSKTGGLRAIVSGCVKSHGEWVCLSSGSWVMLKGQ